MDRRLQQIKFSRFICVVNALFVLVFLCACSKQESRNPYANKSVAQLEVMLYEQHDLESFNELAIRYFQQPSIDIKKYARFMTDSLKSLNALAFMGDTYEEMLYYQALCNAYDAGADLLCELSADNGIEIKQSLYDFYSSRFVEFANWETYKCDSAIRAAQEAVRTDLDTAAYLYLREHIPACQLKESSSLLSDSLGYAPAVQDMYQILCIENWDGFAMDSSAFSSAYSYLERGVECGFLPSIWQKSLLLLMGVYLPQDTVEGKKLLNECLKNPPCETPFWRK